MNVEETLYDLIIISFHCSNFKSAREAGSKKTIEMSEALKAAQ